MRIMMARIALCSLLTLPAALGFVVTAPSPGTRGLSRPVCAPRRGRAGWCAAAKALDQVAAAAALADAHADARSRLAEAGFMPDAPPGVSGGELLQLTMGPAGASATVTSFRGVDETRNAWASSLCLHGEGFARFALQAWNGPEIDVPNLFASATATSDGIDLHLDLRPRLDAGYDEDPTAPPATREGFVRIANRERYDELYFTAEARAAAAALRSAGESYPAPGDVVQGRATDRPGVVAGPLLVHARFPLTDQSLVLCSNAIRQTMDRYCTWMAHAEQVPWVTTRLLYDRDCQVRLKMFQRAVQEYGVDVAAADAGEMGMVGHNSLGLGRGD